MLPRFFSNELITSSAVEITGSEQHHMTHVLRLRAGSRVILFDDSGAEFEAELTDVQRHMVRLHIHARRDVDRELPFCLSLGVALPKGERQQWLVEKAVELGVTKLVPLRTARGVAQPHDKSLERLERWVVAAAKQCGRNRLMQIAPPEAAADFFARADAGTVLVAHPDTAALSLPRILPNLKNSQAPIGLAIGPEGGFTEAEIATAQQVGCHFVNLGARILRTETAAVALVASIIYTRGIAFT